MEVADELGWSADVLVVDLRLGESPRAGLVRRVRAHTVKARHASDRRDRGRTRSRVGEVDPRIDGSHEACRDRGTCQCGALVRANRAVRPSELRAGDRDTEGQWHQTSARAAARCVLGPRCRCGAQCRPQRVRGCQRRRIRLPSRGRSRLESVPASSSVRA